MEDFPTPASFISDVELEEEMKYLSSLQPDIQEKKYIINNMLPDRSVGKMNVTPLKGLVLSVPEPSKADLISGVFSGLVRSRCRRTDEKLSPYDYWKLNKTEVLKKAGKNASVEQLDNTLWTLVRGCGAFKPRVAAGIIEHFGATRVLDFSSGWGDRLLAAIAKEVRYVGVDPNPDLQEPYKEMITLSDQPERYTMIMSPFQTAELPEETYDLVFTSPPYYDLELYNSKLEGSNLDSWKTEFLYASIHKAWDVLDEEGYLCLSINDYNLQAGDQSQRVRYVADMVRYVSTLPGAENLGSIYRDICKPYLASSSGRLSAAPLWAWKKNSFQERRSIMNPDVVISKYQIDDRSLLVIRDDLLEAGTKQRAALPYLKSFSDYSEFVYAGHEGGHGHLCIAIVAEALGKKATLFLQSATGAEVDLVKRARTHGARIYLIQNKLSVAREDASKYVARTRGSLMIPLGLDTAEYQCHMVRALEESFPRDIHPKRMWVIVGTGRLLHSLMEVFPETEFLTVRIGRELRDGSRTTYISKYTHGQEVRDEDIPPYPASRMYEAKLWPYIREYALDGDYVWNVAG